MDKGKLEPVRAYAPPISGGLDRAAFEAGIREIRALIGNLETSIKELKPSPPKDAAVDKIAFIITEDDQKRLLPFIGHVTSAESLINQCRSVTRLKIESVEELRLETYLKDRLWSRYDNKSQPQLFGKWVKELIPRLLTKFTEGGV